MKKKIYTSGFSPYVNNFTIEKYAIIEPKYKQDRWKIVYYGKIFLDKTYDLIVITHRKSFVIRKAYFKDDIRTFEINKKGRRNYEEYRKTKTDEDSAFDNIWGVNPIR